jgi:hypothetical protein
MHMTLQCEQQQQKSTADVPCLGFSRSSEFEVIEISFRPPAAYKGKHLLFHSLYRI